ncbi:MAG TPA: hypothetical protein VIG97_03550 [Luteimonas sp.]
MTILFRSKNKATRSLGNIYGVTRSPDYSALIDFNLGACRVRSGESYIDLPIGDAVVCERATPGEYLDKNGVVRVAGSNVPRISYFPEYGLSGLLIEPERTNHLNNPLSPVTQTVSVPSAAANLYVVLTVEGTGSAAMSGDISGATPPAISGRSQGAVLVNPGSGTSSVTVTVTGNVTRFQLEVANGGSASGPHATSFMPSGVTTRAEDRCRISDAVFSRLGSGKGTIVGHFIDTLRTPNPVTSAPGYFALLNSGALSGGLHLRRAVSPSNTQVIANAVTQGANTSAKQATAVIIGSRDTTAALSYDNAGQIMRSAVNGVGTEATGAYSFTPTQLYLGGRGPSNFTSGGWRGFGGILTSLLIYNRAMEADELAAVSRLWQA